MADDERLFELLERWEELQRQGQEISARELCADAPELQRKLEQAIGCARWDVQRAQLTDDRTLDAVTLEAQQDSDSGSAWA